MTKDQWIERARKLLADNEDAKELLETEPEAEVVEVEVAPPPPLPSVAAIARVDSVEVEAEGEDGQSQPITTIKVDDDRQVPARRPAPARRGFLARFGNVANKVLEVADKAGDEPLTGFDRLDVKMGETAEKLVDTGLDKLKDIPKHAPTLRDRGSAWRNRKLGRQKA